MKRFFTLLWLTLVAFTFNAHAQQTTCNAEFSWQFVNNNTVKFIPVTNDSPMVHHEWNFGDGTPNSNVVSPVHTYTSPGTYVVKHTIARFNSAGAPVCTAVIIHTITIQGPPVCTLVANFTWTMTAANPLVVEFHNTSVPPDPSDSVRWNFGDGTVINGLQGNPAIANPVHTYLQPGTYNVCLRVKKNINTNPNQCVSEICKTIIIPAPCNLVADFSWNATASNPLQLEFHNLSTPSAPGDSLRWIFGDGTVLNGLGGNPAVANPVHLYATAGTYSVCLIVKKNDNAPGTNPCIRYICKTVVVPTTTTCNLVANFTWNATTANPLMLEFHNTSTPSDPSDSVRWNFGDGTVINGIQGNPAIANPVHTYLQPGTYNVCIRVKKNLNTSPNNPCIKELCKTVIVSPLCNLVVDYTWNAIAANPLTIEFHNQSTPSAPGDSVRWSFGDGTSISGLQSNPAIANPVHTYANAGTYTVCLIVRKNDNPPGTNPCIRYICKTITVQAPCNLIADFTWNPSQNDPLRIEFHNTSNPVAVTDSVRWTFGDGTSVNGIQGDPTVANPVHTYAQPGTYTICLRIKRNNNTGSSTCVREICKTIVIPPPPCNFVVNFSWQLDQANPRKVYFTNLTVSPSANAVATWTFGDGTSATSWNAVHEYAQPGRYYVCLKVQISNTCIRYKCDSVLIPAPLPPCNNQSNFTVLSTSTNSQTFTFIPAFQSPTAVYTWTFGDGTGSHDMIATHHYTQPGTYTACLTVWRSATCASTTCKTVQVTPQINCDSVHVTYSYQPDPQVPNKIHFYANSNVPILDQTWTIVKMPVSSTNQTVTLHQNNPTYLFPDTGYYRVCLRAITLGGCIKEYCSIIHIAQLGTNACILQAYPNPASSVVNVNVVLTAPEMIHAYIYNSQNVLVKTKDQQGVTGNNVVSITVGDLPAGSYTIKLIYGNHICYSMFQKL